MIWRVILLTLALAGPAQAGLAFAFMGFAGFGGLAAGLTVLGGLLTSTVLGRIALSVGISLLSRALQKKPPRPGIRTDQTLRGEGQPQTFILGRYSIGGFKVAPDMSHGSSRGWLTYVVDLGDVPGQSLEGLIVDDEYAPIDWGASPHPSYGQPVTGTYAGYAYVRFYDGSQTTADAHLTATYAAYDGRPWTADMALRGVPYVILSFNFDDTVWRGLPAVRFVAGGIPLYDPRADTTVGGSGPQRLADRTTWVRSHNPAVQVYNILRGITLPDGNIWGVGAAAADLPLAVWFAAMNACDVAIPLAAGGSEAQFRTGFEVTVADEPADVIEEMLKGCIGRMAEVGGRWPKRGRGAC